MAGSGSSGGSVLLVALGTLLRILGMLALIPGLVLLGLYVWTAYLAPGASNAQAPPLIGTFELMYGAGIVVGASVLSFGGTLIKRWGRPDEPPPAL